MSFMRESPNFSTDSAKVYIDYPKQGPSSGWTRFVCLADTHSRFFRDVPSGDVLIHAGDLTSYGCPSQILATVNWIKSLPHAVKIIIAGNHDLVLDRKISPRELDYLESEDECTMEQLYAGLKGDECRASGFYYLENESLTFTAPSGREWRVYGSPATPKYGSGSFQYDNPTEGKGIYAAIPDDTEILLTHTPAHTILDKTRRGSHAGCPLLLERLLQLQCRLHVSGHIHEAHGAQTVTNESGGKFIAVNAAVTRSGRSTVVDLLD